MLALSLRPGESIVIQVPGRAPFTLRLVGVQGEKARISFDAPREIQIDREKLYVAKQAATAAAAAH